MVKQQYPLRKTLQDVAASVAGVGLAAGGLYVLYLAFSVVTSQQGRYGDAIVGAMLVLLGFYVAKFSIHQAQGYDWTCYIQQDASGVTFIQESGKRLRLSWSDPHLRLSMSDQSKRPPGFNMRIGGPRIQLSAPGKGEWMGWIYPDLQMALLEQARLHGLTVERTETMAALPFGGGGQRWPVERFEIRGKDTRPLGM